MKLWLKVRAAGFLALITTITAVGTAICRDRTLPVPNLVGTALVPVPLEFLPPLGIALALARALPNSEVSIERAATRRIRLLDATYVWATCVAMLALCVTGTWIFGPGVLATGRNGLGYVGLALIGRALVGASAAGSLPATYLVVASLVRPAAGVWAQTWGWALAPHDSLPSWLCALGLTLVGCTIGIRARG